MFVNALTTKYNDSHMVRPHALSETAVLASLVERIDALRKWAGFSEEFILYGFATARYDSAAARIVQSESALDNLSRAVGNAQFGWNKSEHRLDTQVADDLVTIYISKLSSHA